MAKVSGDGGCDGVCRLAYPYYKKRDDMKSENKSYDIRHDVDSIEWKIDIENRVEKWADNEPEWKGFHDALGEWYTACGVFGATSNPACGALLGIARLREGVPVIAMPCGWLPGLSEGDVVWRAFWLDAGYLVPVPRTEFCETEIEAILSVLERTRI
jgi:hypothetical protein